MYHHDELPEIDFNGRQPIEGKGCLVYFAILFVSFLIWLIVSLIVFFK